MRALEVEGLCVSYGPVPALRDVSLHVEQGELVGLLGPNGAGKSTLVNAVCGVVKPSAGTVAIAGAAMAGVSCERIARLGVSLVPEGRHIFGSLTVRDNLRLGAAARRDGGAGTDAAIERVIERFPVLGRKLDGGAGRLSGGEQQQLAIARALVTDPFLLLLDEPSLGLAPLIVDLVFEVLAELRAEGLTVLLVEQHATRTLAAADRSYVLRSGNVVYEGAGDEHGAKEQLMIASLGEDL
ncbi:MAG TPA: ABC transporter ATP-binding protein [Conexibacter sp.]|jgi:branched-chain amino acid transport system ATP-binding protein|nr:ABC transporter ATP-binding protein [Conexibacter sp.]